MKLTTEQFAIINSSGNIKINAIAGSGKTTTIIEYARSRPIDKKILYLAFNKSVKLEAARKFSELGLQNVQVETAHSLAYRHIVSGTNYKVKNLGYKTTEIAELLKLKGNGEKHAEYIIANHINKFIAYFCNSTQQKVQDLNYLDTISDSKAKKFVTVFYKCIETQTRLLLSKMDKGEIDITHDFYLKKFQLSKPQLYFDYILFDEGQDASPAMLDVFLRQETTKVIVGDINQQIYGWRFAVNSLEKADFKSYNLSASFRFSQDIANLAMGVLEYKKIIDTHKPVTIAGMGNTLSNNSKAILARTNLGLLLKAIEYVNEKKNVNHIYFEGNINSYTYADDGASLYDVLNLYNGKHQFIRDSLIRSMKDIEDLEDYIKKTEDLQLGMMVEIVREYGNEIPSLIRKIKEKHVGNDEKEKAEIIFSTVHRCKGMEYDEVLIVNDFINEERLKKLVEDRPDELDIPKLNEEINLLYVAITRTRNSIHIPETLLPLNFPSSAKIHVIEVIKEEELNIADELIKFNSKSKYKQKKNNKSGIQTGKTIDNIREEHKGAYKPWTNELDEELTKMYCEGGNIMNMVKHFGRTRGAIIARIRKLELEALYGYSDNLRNEW